MNDPGAVSKIARFSPAFCLTFSPGFSTVPLAEAVILVIVKFSVTIRLCSATSLAVTRWMRFLRRLATLRWRLAYDFFAFLARFDRLPRNALDRARCSSLRASVSALSSRSFSKAS